MKTHEHALISLGYSGLVTLLAGHGLTDYKIYLASLIGGEILDFIDHPLYHLVYNRNEPHVAKARYLFFNEGLRSAITYLNQVEDKREFKGLLLHNIYSLTVFALFGIGLSLFLPGPVYWFTFFGALLLHMLTDIYSDITTVGHMNNWLWVIPESLLTQWEQTNTQLVYRRIIWIVIIVSALLIVTFRWGWQLARTSEYAGLYTEIVNFMMR